MTSRVTRAASALLASAALIAGTATSASAATWSHSDARGDVATSDNGGQTSTPDPTNAITDIAGVRVSNGTRLVVVKLKTRAAIPGTNYALEVEIKTSTTRYLALRANQNGHGGVALLKGATPKSCSGLKVTIDRTTFLSTFTVPRSCLGNPGYIKVGVGADTSNTDDSQEWFDDALRTGDGNALTLSPGIARG